MSQTTQQETQADALECIVGAEALRQTIDAVHALADESRWHLGSHGLHVTLCDPGNVAMMGLEFDAAGFEAVGEGSYTVGLNHDRLEDVTAKAGNDDLVELSFREETRKLGIRYGRVDVELASIDPSAIRQEPDIPDLDLPNRLEVSGETLLEAVEVAEMVSDHLWIRADVDDEYVGIEAAGDIDTAGYEFDDDATEFADVRETVETCLSLEYMKDMTKPIPKDATVELTFGDEFPLITRWSYADGASDVTQTLAPRIVSD